MNCRIIVSSCPAYRPVQALWWTFFKKNWPDCPFPVEVISLVNDIGWNANLMKTLDEVSEPFILLMLEDHFIESVDEAGINVALDLMDKYDIGLIKLQAGNAAQPELEFPPYQRLMEYDRGHHPFKRLNLVPTLFRRDFLRRASAAVLGHCGVDKDRGRQGALEFEVEGTRITQDAIAWPERFLGIDRSAAGGGSSLLTCLDSDGIRERRMKPLVAEWLTSAGIDYASVPGIEEFL